VRLQDAFGINIVYSPTLEDMALLEEELIKTGSYYLHQFLQNKETEQANHIHTNPSHSQASSDQSPKKAEKQSVGVIDRDEVTLDLLTKEKEFMYEKIHLIEQYMNAYSHVCDIVEQHKLIQIITDLMALRPRFNVNAPYFIDSYNAEIQCVKKLKEFVGKLVQHQVKVEKNAIWKNKVMLDRKFGKINQYLEKKWKYNDHPTIQKEYERKQSYRMGNFFVFYFFTFFRGYA
jgi:hypothetical protein